MPETESALTTVPLGGPRPYGDRTCARLTADGHCAESAVVHVLWDSDMNNGVACFRHWKEARILWPFLDHHGIGDCCTLPGTVWFASESNPPGYCAIAVDPSLVELESVRISPESRRCDVSL